MVATSKFFSFYERNDCGSVWPLPRNAEGVGKQAFSFPEDPTATMLQAIPTIGFNTKLVDSLKFFDGAMAHFLIRCERFASCRETYVSTLRVWHKFNGFKSLVRVLTMWSKDFSQATNGLSSAAGDLRTSKSQPSNLKTERCPPVISVARNRQK